MDNSYPTWTIVTQLLDNSYNQVLVNFRVHSPGDNLWEVLCCRCANILANHQHSLVLGLWQ